MPGWRIVLISQVAEAVAGMSPILDALGHEVVGVLTVRMNERSLAAVTAAPSTADVVSPATRERMAPLLASFEPDLTICLGFPWKIRAEAIAVPRLGALNVHPSALPRYRGPSPIPWMLLNGDSEVGMTVHRMDGELDTGPILAQATAPLEPGLGVEGVTAKLAGLLGELLPAALERVARGEEGDPQTEEGASYAPFLGPEHAEIDWSRPAREVHNLVVAWQFGSGVGPYGEVGGERRLVIETRLDPHDGAVRVECGDGPIWVVASGPVV